MTQKWLTLAQACAYTGRSASTLKRKATQGLIFGPWKWTREIPTEIIKGDE